VDVQKRTHPRLGNEYPLVIDDLTLSLPGQGGTERPDMVRTDIPVSDRRRWLGFLG
jgi:hypothetical protein